MVSDLKLKPGETKTFRYEIMIPTVLPPSFFGKVVKINYRFVVGVQRPDMSRKAHIFRVPFRLFNRTNGKFLYGVGLKFLMIFYSQPDI